MRRPPTMVNQHWIFYTHASTNNTYKTNYCLTFSPGRRQWRQPCPAYPQSLGPRWSRQCQRTWQTRSREKLSIALSRNPTFSSYDNIIIIWSDHQMMINVSMTPDYHQMILSLIIWWSWSNKNLSMTPAVTVICIPATSSLSPFSSIGASDQFCDKY